MTLAEAWRRPSALVGLTLTLAVVSACSQSQNPTTATETPFPSSSVLTGPPVVFTQALLARLPIGGAGQPRVSAPGVGGAGWSAPQSLAVDARGEVWIWDHQSTQLYSYDTRGVAREALQTTVPGSAGDLLAASGKLYLRAVDVAYVIDPSTGATTRSTQPYPRPRSTLVGLVANEIRDLGSDALGNRYEVSSCTGCLEFRRVSAAGLVSALGRTDASVVDVYLDDLGAVYEMSWERSDGRPVALLIRRVLGPP
jgi:hypothetical protein